MSGRLSAKTASMTTPLISTILPGVPCACSDMSLLVNLWEGSATRSAANALAFYRSARSGRLVAELAAACPSLRGSPPERGRDGGDLLRESAAARAVGEVRVEQPPLNHRKLLVRCQRGPRQRPLAAALVCRTAHSSRMGTADSSGPGCGWRGCA